MSESITAIPSEAGSQTIFYPERVAKRFLETSRSQGAIIVYLEEDRFSLLDLSTDPHPLESFNRSFMRDYPHIFNNGGSHNRIVRSYLAPEMPMDFSSSIEFVLQPSALARDSSHGVFFGILRPAYDSGSPGIEVAVKPYSGENTLRAYTRAWREFINSHIVSRRGIPTIKPLALVFDDKNAYIISRREKLTALGDVLWEPFRRELGTLRALPDIEQFIQTKYKHLIAANPGSGFASQDQQLSQYFAILRNIAICFAKLHSKGIFPKDSQIKNFVSEALTNQVWAIDWENTTITFGSTEESSKNAYYGITQLLLSLLVRRVRQNTEQGVSGVGLFDLYFSNIVKDLQTQRPEIIGEMKELNPRHSEALLAVTDKITGDLLVLFDALFLQHYRAGMNNHSNPQIAEEEQGFKSKMLRHIISILVRDVDYYLSL